MSYSQIKDWSKNELKNRLLKMGISIDKNDHPKSYYEKLYLEQMNAKNKITRNNHPFGKRQLLKSKRERNNSKEKEEDEEYLPDDNSLGDYKEDNNEIDNINENESDENNQEDEDIKKSEIGLKKFMTKDIIDLNKNYKESGIKYTRLILMKKRKTKEKKALIINQESNDINKNIIYPKINVSEAKDTLISNDHYENEFNKEIPLKQSNKSEQNNIIENNELLIDNKDIEKTPDIKKDKTNNVISLKVQSNNSQEKTPETGQNQVLFGAPKTYDKNSNIFLSQGPISFGFNQSTNSKKSGNTDSNKDNNTNKRYNAFVKNISEAVKDNIKESQSSENKKAKTILLKWESPSQKEFLSHSMDIENNLEDTDNKINVSYNFNERLNNLDKEDVKFGKGSQNKRENYLSHNNYINKSKKPNFNKAQNTRNDINEYKNQLRGYDKNKSVVNNYINEQNDNNEETNIKNPFYSSKNPDKEIESDYVESHDIYNNLNQQEDQNYYSKNDYYNSINNAIYESEYAPNEEQKDYNNNLYIKNLNEQNSQFINVNSAKNDFNQKTLEDKIKYINKAENINSNAENEKDIYESEIEINNYLEGQREQKKKGQFLNRITQVKNSIMNQFKNKAYLLPLILLIVFGIVYFLNNTYERFDNYDIIIVFSILMGLIVLYHIIRYLLTKRNYKKMAKADRIALLDLLKNNNITHEELANNMMLISNFINTRIKFHKLNQDEYMKYVFKYLKKYLKKDGFNLNIEENNEESSHDYWKEI